MVRGVKPLAALVVTLTLATTTLRADEPKDTQPSQPEIPECTDTILFGPKKKPQDAKPARDRDGEDCKKTLDAARNDLKNKEKALDAAVADKKPTADIAAAERDVASSRAAYLVELDECGPCAINHVEQTKIISPEKTEIWYESLGTCTVDVKKFGKAPYDRIVKYLSNVENYPAYKKNGLRNILEFIGVDRETGEPRPEWKDFEKPFPLFIAVLGPTFFGETFSPGYFIENTIKSTKAPWNLEFKTVPEIKGFKGRNKVAVRSATGKSIPTRPLSLHNVKGQWCVREKGFSYYTAADFGSLGVVKGFTTELAKSVLLETVAHLYEVGTEEKP